MYDMNWRMQWICFSKQLSSLYWLIPSFLTASACPFVTVWSTGIFFSHIACGGDSHPVRCSSFPGHCSWGAGIVESPSLPFSSFVGFAKSRAQTVVRLLSTGEPIEQELQVLRARAGLEKEKILGSTKHGRFGVQASGRGRVDDNRWK